MQNSDPRDRIVYPIHKLMIDSHIPLGPKSAIKQTNQYNILQILMVVKMRIFSSKFFYFFSSKHRLWVHIRTAYEGKTIKNTPL